MSVTVKKFDGKKEGLLDAAFAIRQEVFIEGQQVPHELEKDGYDPEAIHYLLIFNDKYIGTARRRLTSQGVKLERFAVLPKYRNRGLGKKLLQIVMEDLKSYPGQIYLNAQQMVVSFYEQAGFEKVGDPFEEAGILHFRMNYVG